MGVKQHLDPWSSVTIVITLVLFLAALFVKGLGHDILLEAGVFLVSVKLIVMAYKNGVANAELESRVERLHAILTRIERVLESRHQDRSAVGPTDKPLRTASGETASR